MNPKIKWNQIFRAPDTPSPAAQEMPINGSYQKKPEGGSSD